MYTHTHARTHTCIHKCVSVYVYLRNTYIYIHAATHSLLCLAMADCDPPSGSRGTFCVRGQSEFVGTDLSDTLHPH